MEKQKRVNKSALRVSKIGTPILGIANGTLTGIFFYMIVGDLSSMMDFEVANWLRVIASIAIGVGWTLAEFTAATNWDYRTNDWVTIYLVFLYVLFMGANIGAGFWRDAVRSDSEKRQAIEMVHQDPRFVSLQKEAEAITARQEKDSRSIWVRVRGRSMEGQERLKEIRTEQAKLEREYISAFSISDPEGLPIWARIALAIILIGINLAFSYMAHTGYGDEIERKVQLRVDRNQPISIEELGEMLNAQGVEYSSNGHDQPEEKARDDRPIGFHHGEFQSIKKNNITVKLDNGSLKKANRKKKLNKTQRLANLRALLATNPRASMEDKMAVTGVNSRTTIYKYEDELSRQRSN